MFEKRRELCFADLTRLVRRADGELVIKTHGPRVTQRLNTSNEAHVTKGLDYFGQREETERSFRPSHFLPLYLIIRTIVWHKFN